MFGWKLPNNKNAEVWIDSVMKGWNCNQKITSHKEQTDMFCRRAKWQMWVSSWVFKYVSRQKKNTCLFVKPFGEKREALFPSCTLRFVCSYSHLATFALHSPTSLHEYICCLHCMSKTTYPWCWVQLYYEYASEEVNFTLTFLPQSFCCSAIALCIQFIPHS